MNILILCDFYGNSAGTIIDHCLSFKKYSRYNYYYFNPVFKKKPKWLILDDFDTIVIHYSIYTMSDKYLHNSWREAISSTKAFKIQFIQDEYRNVNKFIELMNYHKIDLLYTCFPPSEIEKEVAAEITDEKPTDDADKTETEEELEIEIEPEDMPPAIGDIIDHPVAKEFLRLEEELKKKKTDKKKKLIKKIKDDGKVDKDKKKEEQPAEKKSGIKEVKDKIIKEKKRIEKKAEVKKKEKKKEKKEYKNKYKDKYETKSFISMPIVGTKKVVAVLNLTENKNPLYTMNDLEVLNIITKLSSKIFELIQIKKKTFSKK